QVALAVAVDLRTFLRLQRCAEARVCVRLPGVGVRRSWDVPSLQALRSGFAGKRWQEEAAAPWEQLDTLREFAGIAAGASAPESLATLAFLYMYLAISAKEFLSFCPCVAFPWCSVLKTFSAVCLRRLRLKLCVTAGVAEPLLLIFLLFRWTEEELTLINSWAFQGERVIHGNPSGVDNAVGTWGGALRYQSGKITPLKRMPRKQHCCEWVSVSNLLICLVLEEPIEAQLIICSIYIYLAVSEMCSSGQRCISTSELELFDINQHHLNVIGVSHPSLDRLCRVTASHGLHSKLTGAGGGGCGITLLRPDTSTLSVEAAKRDLCACGFECWETSIGAPGVTLHSSSSLKAEVLHALTES
ncbi:KIME kinase, partial [Columbina picui]|nr:KIME kinase [Columbina picui]